MAGPPDPNNPWVGAAAPQGVRVVDPKAVTGADNSNPWAGASAERGATMFGGSDQREGTFWDDLKYTWRSLGPRMATSLAGMPVDSYNAIGNFLATHPETATDPGEAVSMAFRPASDHDLEKTRQSFKPVETGSSAQLAKLSGSIGIPTETSEQDKVHLDWLGRTGETVGEFAGPSMGLGAVRITGSLVRGGLKTAAKLAAKDTLYAGIGPGFAGAQAGEIAGNEYGPETQEAAKDLVAIGLGLRPSLIEKGFKGVEKGASWVGKMLGMDLGTEGRVRGAINRVMGPEGVTAALNTPGIAEGTTAPAGLAGQPTDVIAGNKGLIALRAEVLRQDANLAGDYERGGNALQQAITENTQLHGAGAGDVQAHMVINQHQAEMYLNQRLISAEQTAEQNTAIALRNTEGRPIDAQLAAAAYSRNLHAEITAADDDMYMLQKWRWNQPDTNAAKATPLGVETNAALYDQFTALKARHMGREGEPDNRFPSDQYERLFGTNDRGARVRKYGPDEPLSTVQNLQSDLLDEIRRERASIADGKGDRVKMAYLTDMSKAYQSTIERVAQATGNPALLEAKNMTALYHDTFTKGPVGDILGHSIKGDPRVDPAVTLKHFLANGSQGIANTNALLRALEQRTGLAGMPGDPKAAGQVFRDALRQDFANTAMPNGAWNQKAAEKWMTNNAAAMSHFSNGGRVLPGAIAPPPDLREEFSAAIASQGDYAALKQAEPRSLQDIRQNQAAKFLNGKPGELFNGAVNTPNEADATRKMVALVKQDPTGRALEGLNQMALDHMLASAKTTDALSPIVDPATGIGYRVSGKALLDWVNQHRDLVQILNSNTPGFGGVVREIANNAVALERTLATPNVVGAQFEGSKLNFMQVMTARILGADLFSRLGIRGGSIQTASIGSQFFKRLAIALTPDKAVALFKEALNNPEVFRALMTRDPLPAQQQQIASTLMPYMVGLFAQPAHAALTGPDNAAPPPQPVQ